MFEVGKFYGGLLEGDTNDNLAESLKSFRDYTFEKSLFSSIGSTEQHDMCLNITPYINFVDNENHWRFNPVVDSNSKTGNLDTLYDVKSNFTDKEVESEIAAKQPKSKVKPGAELKMLSHKKDKIFDREQWELLELSSFGRKGRTKQARFDISELPDQVEFGRLVATGLEGGVSVDKSMLGSKKNKRGRNDVYNLLKDKGFQEVVNAKVEKIHNEALEKLDDRKKRRYKKKHNI